jgi:hypothetical protein
MNKLGVFRDWQGRYAESEKLFREALAIRRRALGQEHPKVLQSMANLGRAIHRQGRMAEAEHLYRATIEHERSARGKEGADVRPVNRWLAALLRTQGRLEEAEPFLRDHLRARRRVSGDEHPETVGTMNGLATLLREMGQLEEAERLGAEAVRKGQHYWMDERPQGAATLLLEHGRTLIALGRFAPAEIELREALDMSELPVVVNNPPRFRRFQRDLAEAFAELYEAWHAAEPDQGYDMEAAEWRARLEEVEAVDAREGYG